MVYFSDNISQCVVDFDRCFNHTRAAARPLLYCIRLCLVVHFVIGGIYEMVYFEKQTHKVDQFRAQHRTNITGSTDVYDYDFHIKEFSPDFQKFLKEIGFTS